MKKFFCVGVIIISLFCGCERKGKIEETYKRNEVSQRNDSIGSSIGKYIGGAAVKTFISLAKSNTEKKDTSSSDTSENNNIVVETVANNEHIQNVLIKAGEGLGGAIGSMFDKKDENKSEEITE